MREEPAVSNPAPVSTSNERNRRAVLRGCCITSIIAFAVAVALSVALWRHMRARMTSDPADTRLVQITAAPSVDAWIDSLEIPVKELDEGLLDPLREEWPTDARMALIEAEVPNRAMPASEELRGYEVFRSRDFTLLPASGEEAKGRLLTGNWGGRQIISASIKTDDQLLYPGGFLDVFVIAPLPADALPGEIEFRYRDTLFATVDLPADAGASEVEVLWREE